MPTVKELEAKLIPHEMVSAERYGTLIKRVDHLELIMLSTAGTLIVGMAGIILTIALKGA